MRSALWRILTLAFLVGLFDLSGHALNLLHAGHAFAATSAARQESPAKPNRMRTSRIHLYPTALGLTTIQNVRTASSPGLTRLVLDLDAMARPNKHLQLQAEGVTIKIPNATLSHSAKRALTTGRLAKPFIISQSSEQSVEVSLPAGSFQRYKLLTLSIQQTEVPSDGLKAPHR